MLAFSAVKCITGFVVYNSFKREYLAIYGDAGTDAFWNNSSNDAG